jgi:cell wall-associated NlpC family hydrolase
MSRAVAAARSALGVRFRLHGRGGEGLDCVGLALLAVRAEGFEGTAPSGYALRSNDVARVRAAIEALGLRAAAGAQPGDLLLVRAGPGQLHFAIQTETGVIHADGLLRRVVERPDVPWPVLGRWRLTTGD